MSDVVLYQGLAVRTVASIFFCGQMVGTASESMIFKVVYYFDTGTTPLCQCLPMVFLIRQAYATSVA